MPRLIKNGELVDNPWAVVPRDEAVDEALGRGGDKLIVPAQLWLDHKDRLRASGKDIAVWLDSDQHPDLIAADLETLPLVGLNFPLFKDGRAFSHAVVLRTHYQYAGEVRAIGDVQRDLLFYMKRCGFDAFELAENVKTEDALSAFGDYRDNYQSTVEQPVPLFRRRG